MVFKKAIASVLIITFSLLICYPASSSQSIKQGEKAPYDGRIFTQEETKEILIRLDQLEQFKKENKLLLEKIEALQEKIGLLEKQNEVLQQNIELYKQQLQVLETMKEQYRELWRQVDEDLLKKEKGMSPEMRAGIYTLLVVLGMFIGAIK